ncbi:MAG TPA: hypothetical protein VJU15_08005 [Gemmatimonadales bacterium]|nr:hypothetical protein [Gemmatimonadales bacterium]
MRRSLLLLGFLASCGGTDAVPDIPPGSQSVPFTALNALFGGDRIQNNWSGGSSRQVVHNQSEWNQLFQTVTGESPAPAIDFTGQHVFFATTGVKIVTGHDIVIDEMWKAPDGRLLIVVRSVSPGGACGGQSLTNSPVTAVLSISEYTGITWLERQSVDNCTSS